MTITLLSSWQKLSSRPKPMEKGSWYENSNKTIEKLFDDERTIYDDQNKRQNDKCSDRPKGENGNTL